MQFDRAMALLLSGQKVQRTTWIRPEKNTHLKIINDGNTSHAVADGVEIVFGRPIAFTNDIHISGRDMVAGDWVVVAALSTSQSDPAPEIAAQCCMCGKKGLSTVEGDGGTECELSDGRWTCSSDCYDRATETPMDQSLWRFWNEKARQQVTEIAALRAENERLKRTVDFVVRWAWRTDPPNAVRNLTDSERLSAIKYYPEIKRAAVAPEQGEA